MTQASSVLVTGTTGFPGAFLLDHLLRNTGGTTRFYCLVRDRGAGPGKPSNRVLETLKFYGLAGQSPDHRIVPVPGDLTLPRMGLYNDRHQELAERLCHASIEITLNLYSHVLPTVQRNAVDTSARLGERASHRDLLNEVPLNEVSVTPCFS